MRLTFTLCCLLLLSACSSEPKLHTIGTIDDEKIITPKDLADLGYDAFREKYLGKEVTLTGFYSAKYTGLIKKSM